MKKNFVIIDDHPMIIEGYQSILQRHFPHANFCTAFNISSAIDLAQGLAYIDFLIIDYSLKSDEGTKEISNGIDLALWYRGHFCSAKILVITAHEEALTIFKIHKKGNPDGLLIKKDVTADVLYESIMKLEEGSRYYSNHAVLAMKLIAQKDFLQQEYNLQILMYLNDGYKIHEISELLAVSEGMLNKRIAKLKSNFKVGDNGKLLREVKKQGFI